jgi:hypothetical protein
MRGFSICPRPIYEPEFEETDLSLGVLGSIEPVESVFGFCFLPMVLPALVAVSA